MIEKETRKQKTMGEAGQNTGKRGEKVWGQAPLGEDCPCGCIRAGGCSRAGEQPRRAAGSLRNLVC